MKNMKKKLFAYLMAAVMMALPILNVSAAELTEPPAHEEIEIIFPENTVFSARQRELITNTLMGKDTPTPILSFCWLVGHSYVYDTAQRVTHKARTVSPRCLQETYRVTTCKNCNYCSEELTESRYIFCC